MKNIHNVKKFESIVIETIQKIIKSQQNRIIETAKQFYSTYKNDGMIYIFGTGHSHMMAEEGHFRAGGFAPICPILFSGLMLHEGANLSSLVERTEGITESILKQYKINSNDLLVIFSNSGVNQSPLEAAFYAKSINCKSIGISSLEYSKCAPMSKYKKRLDEVVDIFFDNHGPAGDALIEIKKFVKVSPFSTIGGSFILNSIISEVAELSKNEELFPFYISGNMPHSKEHNQKLLSKYLNRNPHI